MGLLEDDLPEGKKKGRFNCFSSDFKGVDTRLCICKTKLYSLTAHSSLAGKLCIYLLLIPYSPVLSELPRSQFLLLGTLEAAMNKQTKLYVPSRGDRIIRGLRGVHSASFQKRGHSSSLRSSDPCHLPLQPLCSPARESYESCSLLPPNPGSFPVHRFLI